MRVVIAILFVLIFCDAHSVSAYNESAHYSIVLHAFDYMINKPTGAQRYFDGWTAEKDAEIAANWAGGKKLDKGKFQNALTMVADKLGQAAANTDRMQDVFVKIDSPIQRVLHGAYTTFIEDVYLTTLSHFVNVPREKDFWDKNGYYFPWVVQHKSCDNFGLENYAFWIGDARIIKTKSRPYERYKGGLIVSDSSYEMNFDQRIRDVRFWPLHNLAAFWYEEYLGSPQNQGLPAYEYHLGPVLHAVQDASQPLHAVGMSGCGHREYEDFIDVLQGKNGELYHPKIVAEHLVTKDFLSSATDIKQLVRSIADRAAFTCKNDGLSSDCGKLNDYQRARDLFNLAVAGSVVVIRKAWIEWQAKVKQGSKANHLNESHKIVPVAVGTDRSARSEASKVVIRPNENYLKSIQKSQQVKPLAYEKDKLPANFIGYGPEFTQPLSRITEGLTTYLNGTMKEPDFRSEVRKNQLSLKAFFETYKLEIPDDNRAMPASAIQDRGIYKFEGWPPVGPVLPRSYRMPTRAEAANESRWNEYVRTRANHLNSIAMVKTSLNKAWVEAELGRENRVQQKSSLENDLKDILVLEEFLFNVLAKNRFPGQK